MYRLFFGEKTFGIPAREDLLDKLAELLATVPDAEMHVCTETPILFPTTEALREHIQQTVMLTEEVLLTIGISRARLNVLVSEGRITPLVSGKGSSIYYLPEVLEMQADLEERRKRYGRRDQR